MKYTGIEQHIEDKKALDNAIRRERIERYESQQREREEQKKREEEVKKKSAVTKHEEMKRKIIAAKEQMESISIGDPLSHVSFMHVITDIMTVLEYVLLNIEEKTEDQKRKKK